MKKASEYYYHQVASHGGYVYFYTPDLTQRWGEGVATQDQIWVQPPGTPTVGLAYLQAYHATRDRFYLDAATAAAEALVYGQLRSGGWTNCVDFARDGSRVSLYRNGQGRGRNNSSLDDGQTQSALRLLMHVDKAHQFKHAPIHESASIALAALLDAQFPNGGFPQVWNSPVEPQPVVRASYPDYDWRSEKRVKEYWDRYTLNDNVCGHVADVLIDANRIYGDRKYLQSLRKLGDFLLLAQMPEPQPAWAQQYGYTMHPIWARRFEPPAISGDESQEVLETLMKIFAATGNRRYLRPLPRAIEYLQSSLLDDGQLARYYELKTNRPLYMTRQGSNYTLTYDDANLPAHYAWKTKSKLEKIKNDLEFLTRSGNPTPAPSVKPTAVRNAISALDDQGRWLSIHTGQRLTGQTKMPTGAPYLSSEVFSKNLSLLAEFVKSAADAAE